MCLVGLCVMPVHVPRLTNYHILCLLVGHLSLCNLFFQISVVLPLTPLVAKNTMLLHR
jgi:hypothetical protein